MNEPGAEPLSAIDESEHARGAEARDGRGPSTFWDPAREEPPQGFEPWTYALRKHRSTAELRWRARGGTRRGGRSIC